MNAVGTIGEFIITYQYEIEIGLLILLGLIILFAIIRAFARAKPAPIATFYKGNRVLVVETLEDENAYE